MLNGSTNTVNVTTGLAREQLGEARKAVSTRYMAGDVDSHKKANPARAPQVFALLCFLCVRVCLRRGCPKKEPTRAPNSTRAPSFLKPNKSTFLHSIPSPNRCRQKQHLSYQQATSGAQTDGIRIGKELIWLGRVWES